ncbi:hypothetical protein ACQJBY_043316 [Aegilops geniculata]
MAPPGPSVLENAGVSDSANITESNVEKLLEIGGGSWDRDTVIKFYPMTRVLRLQFHVSQRTSLLGVQMQQRIRHLLVLLFWRIPQCLILQIYGSESKVKLVLSVGDGKWDIDAVTTALAAFNNDAANAIVFLSPSKDSGTSSPNQPKSKKQKIGIESSTDVPGSAPVLSEPFDASAAALPAISSHATKSKKEKKVKCAKCKKHRQVCQDDCVFRVFTTEK